MNRRLARKIEPYLYVLPAVIGIVIVTGGAILAGFGLGFTHWDVLSAPRFAGLNNYITMLDSGLFGRVVGQTLYFILLYVPLSVAGAMLLALLVNNRLRGIAVFRTVYFFPVVTSMVAVSIVWSWLYNSEYGLINQVLYTTLGIRPRWLDDPALALPAIVLMSVWKNMGYNMMILLAGLQAAPPALTEAAMLDGAGPLRRFFSITLPMISPSLFFVTVITVIGAFQTFEQTYMLTRGGPGNSTLMLGYYIWQNGFQFMKMGYASAVAYVLFAMTAIVTVVQFRLQRRWVHYG